MDYLHFLLMLQEIENEEMLHYYTNEMEKMRKYFFLQYMHALYLVTKVMDVCVMVILICLVVFYFVFS